MEIFRTAKNIEFFNFMQYILIKCIVHIQKYIHESDKFMWSLISLFSCSHSLISPPGLFQGVSED